MKYFFRLLLFVLLSSQNCFGQDTAFILNQSWTSLKTDVQRRVDIILNLTSLISKSSKVDKKELNNSKVFAADLFKHVDTLKSKDSISISFAYTKYTNLTQALARTIATLATDKKIKNNKEVTVLLMHLEGIENRIALDKREYNELCIKYNRTDLLFGPVQSDKESEVKL